MLPTIYRWARQLSLCVSLKRLQPCRSPSSQKGKVRLLLVVLALFRASVSALRQPIGRITTLNRNRLVADEADSLFYKTPRLVNHADDAWLQELTTLYRSRLPPGGRVLDLMSSHVSHLPDDLPLARVDGHGMNAEELARNPAFRLGATHVQDLNREPSLPFAADATYDAILCCCGVQYLEEAERVFAECSRVLVPSSGVLIVSFTNSFFFQKALYGWSERGMATRSKLVRDYMRAAGGFASVEVEGGGTGLLAQLGSISGLGGDPFCAVVGTRDDSVL